MHISKELHTLPKVIVASFETDGLCGLLVRLKHSIKSFNLSGPRGVLLFRTVDDSVVAEAQRYEQKQQLNQNNQYILKEMCRNRDLKLSGKKSELIDRLLDLKE